MRHGSLFRPAMSRALRVLDLLLANPRCQRPVTDSLGQRPSPGHSGLSTRAGFSWGFSCRAPRVTDAAAVTRPCAWGWAVTPGLWCSPFAGPLHKACHVPGGWAHGRCRRQAGGPRSPVASRSKPRNPTSNRPPHPCRSDGRPAPSRRRGATPRFVSEGTTGARPSGLRSATGTVCGLSFPRLVALRASAVNVCNFVKLPGAGFSSTAELDFLQPRFAPRLPLMGSPVLNYTPPPPVCVSSLSSWLLTLSRDTFLRSVFDFTAFLCSHIEPAFTRAH